MAKFGSTETIVTRAVKTIHLFILKSNTRPKGTAKIRELILALERRPTINESVRSSVFDRILFSDFLTMTTATRVTKPMKTKSLPFTINSRLAGVPAIRATKVPNWSLFTFWRYSTAIESAKNTGPARPIKFDKANGIKGIIAPRSGEQGLPK
jgi:hypothetical protein